MNFNANTAKMTRVFMACISIVIAFGGCDRLPSPSSQQAIPTVPQDALVASTNGRGGYDWKFQVTPQTWFQFPHSIDWDKVKENFLPVTTDVAQKHKVPAKLDRDVLETYQCLLEPHTPKLLLELTESDEVGVNAVDLDRAGKRLVTLGNKLIFWNVESGERIAAFPSPIPKAIGVYFDASEKCVIAHNQTEIVRISVDEGEVTARWKATTDGMVSIVVSDRADVIAAATIKGELIVLRENLTELQRCPNFRLHSNRIAIHPDGLWVIASGKSGLVRWKLDQSQDALQTFPEALFEAEDAICTSGVECDRWVGPYFCSYAEHNGQLDEVPKIATYRFNCTIYDAHCASNGWKPDWLVVLAERTNSQGDEDMVVQDISDEAGSSKSWKIPMSHVRRMVGNQSFDRIALIGDGVLRVYARRAWDDARGYRVAEHVKVLFRDGRMDQIELIANGVRQLGRLENNVTGESLYSRIVTEIGFQWANCEATEASLELLDAIDEWYEKGDLLACVCSAKRHLVASRLLREQQVAQSQRNAQQQKITKSLDAALRDARRSVEFEPPPGAAFEMLVYASRLKGVDIKSLDEYMQMYVELYPNEFAAHEAFCSWLLPGVIGSMAKGEAGKVYHVLAENFPEPYGEVLYTRMGVAIYNEYDGSVMVDGAGFNFVRVLAGGDKMMELEIGNAYLYEGLMHICEVKSRDVMHNELLQYHVSHFAFPSRYAYQSEVIQKFPKRQRKSLKRR